MFATYERTVQVKPYETEKASVIVQGDVPVGADDAQVEAAAVAAFHLAKITVLDQLALEPAVIGGRVHESARIPSGAVPASPEVQAHAAAQTTVPAPQAATEPISQAQAVQNVQAAFPQTAPAAAPAPLPPTAPQAQAADGTPPCPKCGGAMWDNRAKKASGEFNPKGPDFGCKNRRNGCDGVVWPPR